jgi:hypothetical protein
LLLAFAWKEWHMYAIGCFAGIFIAGVLALCLLML